MRIALSLVSHTNAGKTTLARTLLQRDIGQVRDAPHVTEFAEDHLLVRSAAGDELRLWDTPGFGDTVRLVRRMRQQGSPLGWFLSEVWDRWRDRPFWASQQALKHVREASDVVLYLVNAAERPEAATYVEPEMQLLEWMGRPVIVLLNQLGATRTPEDEAADVERWRAPLQRWGCVKRVMPLDAFARCWVQEGELLEAVAQVLPAPQREAMRALQATWQDQNRQRFEAAVQVVSRTLAAIAATRVPLDGAGGIGESVRQLSSRLTRWLGGEAGTRDDAASPAQARLLERLDEEVRRGTAELIALHGLEGRAQGAILERVAQQVDVAARIDEGRAAVIGGMVTGALAGLKADLATGGLTLGGGLLAGGVLGALGAAGVARGLNVMRGGGPPWAGWSAEAMVPITEAALLRYLAVAHFGRGRGEWAQGEAPPHWQPLVAELLRADAAAWAALWRSRATRLDAPDDTPALQAALVPRVGQALQAVLVRLYPDARWPAPATAGAGAQSGA